MIDHTVICQYRPRRDAVDDFMVLVRDHRKVLRRAGPGDADTPEVVYVGEDQDGSGPLIVSIFQWLEAEGSRRAAQHPRVGVIWERMETLVERPRDGAGHGLPALLDQGDPLKARSRGLRELDELEAVFAALANEHRQAHPRDTSRTRGSDDRRRARRPLQSLVVDDHAPSAAARVGRSRPRREAADASGGTRSTPRTSARSRRGSSSSSRRDGLRRLEHDHQLPVVALGLSAREVEQAAAHHPAVVR